MDPTTCCRAAVGDEIEPSSRGTLCWCFGENEADIRCEIACTGSSRALERVRARIASEGCACGVLNPRGICCLPDLAVAVRREESRSRRGG